MIKVPIESIDLSSPNTQWVKNDGRFYYHGKQRDQYWYDMRKGRVTASVAYTTTGKSKFMTREELAKQIRGESSKDSTLEMIIGNDVEDHARDQYVAISGNKVTEVAFIIWEKYPELGVSPDGLIGEDGMLEIKAPWKLYAPLIAVVKDLEENLPDPRLQNGWLGRPNHIWYSHYSQMQMQMAIAGRKWCDYVVFGVEEGQLYIERIPFNEKYWQWLLGYIKSFVTEVLPIKNAL